MVLLKFIKRKKQIKLFEIEKSFLVDFGDVIMNNGSVILLNECDWNIYDNIYVLYEIEVKLKIKCVVICF